MLGYLLSLGLGYCCAKLYEKKDKIFQIHDSIAEHVPNFLTSWFKTIQTVVKIKFEGLYDEYVRRIKTSSYITHDIYEVEYFHKGKKYKICFNDPITASSRDILPLNVYDQNGREITAKFLEYLGPRYDFHGRNYTPRDLGYTNIVIFDEELKRTDFSIDKVLEIPSEKLFMMDNNQVI